MSCRSFRAHHLRLEAGAVSPLEWPSSSVIGGLPHRFASLARANCSLRKFAVPYHGLQFDSMGRCVHNPHGPVHERPSGRIRERGTT